MTAANDGEFRCVAQFQVFGVNERADMQGRPSVFNFTQLGSYPKSHPIQYKAVHWTSHKSSVGSSWAIQLLKTQFCHNAMHLYLEPATNKSTTSAGVRSSMPLRSFRKVCSRRSTEAVYPRSLSAFPCEPFHTFVRIPAPWEVGIQKVVVAP